MADAQRIRATAAYLHTLVLPAAYTLLPDQMTDTRATALLLAIAGIESNYSYRKQMGGPARSFWQFEVVGVRGIVQHARSRDAIVRVCDTLQYEATAATIHEAMTHNDILAAVCARLLLWTLPAPLPQPDNADEGWRQYLEAWRPGRPRPSAWPAHYRSAWVMVRQTAEPRDPVGIRDVNGWHERED